MIADGIACCLRPLGIVMNEQIQPPTFVIVKVLASHTVPSFHIDCCPFITNPYGRVHALTAVIIHGAGPLIKFPTPKIFTIIPEASRVQMPF
jgi:hypothetical protein